MNDIRFFEELSMNAHPSVSTVLYDGWILNFSDGYTSRANSVNMIYPSSVALEEKVKRCEEMYASEGLPAIFKITPLSNPELDRMLEERGYEIVTPTNVMTMRLDNLTDDFIPSEVKEGIDKEWQDDYLSLSGLIKGKNADTVRKVQNGIKNRCFCTSIGEKNNIKACGICVIERGYVGIYDIFVEQGSRQNGLGLSVCASLLHKARSVGAENAYLQVVEANAPAMALYAKLGYSFLYSYHYRRRK